MTEPRRTKQLNMRLSEEEEGQLKRLAKHLGLSISSTIRHLIKRYSEKANRPRPR